MPGNVEYDRQAMRSALTTLIRIHTQLHADVRQSRLLWSTHQPGTAPATTQFHSNLQRWGHDISQQCSQLRQELQDAIAGLIAIDRQYNAGELVNELNLTSIRPGG